LDQNEAGRSGVSRSKLSAAKEKAIHETFWSATDEWKKEHPGASGLSDAQRAWRYAVGRAAAKTHADPKTVKRRFPDPVEKARARVRAHVQALGEWTPKK